MPPQITTVLVVDDEPAIRKILKSALSSVGYSTHEARDGEAALGAIREHPVDLVLLDINMPGVGGIESCRRIRKLAPRAGIVMITVRDREDDKVEALEAGADDYVTKPFLLRELLARLRAVLRRTHLDQGQPTRFLRAGDLEVDLHSRILRKSGQEIHLSPKEFELLALLMRHPGVPFTHSKLLRGVWGAEYGGELEYLRTYVKFLRKKIENNPAAPAYILTEPWVGYRFRDPSDPDSPPERLAQNEQSAT
jgi:two-component system KDP operon response regulator KdpE